ncbi:DeoR faimly transcriptional regulator [Massilia sp. WF1]|uniref:dienelactone hydrolase family protein n=1 Tax=unclassified Massilia TaxID=2609279 RepID=UPI000649F8AB|nr:MULTISPECIES: DeoR family transcriptional regulator [unclassified Massilia]ALK99263.1 hydrolase [Massilia sp. WG5]KLU38746.1 DeoR faimly transcriptional regulator [Massilia sp. WF1]
MNAKALIHIQHEDIGMEGMLELPHEALGIVLFAHGSGSSRLSPRNNYVARVLREANIGTLLLDLLSTEEEADPHHRFDIALLTLRLRTAARWLAHEPATAHLPLGLFGASTGAAAALRLAGEPHLGEPYLGHLTPDRPYPHAPYPSIAAVVSRGGRPDLAGISALHGVTAPTLLIVGGKDGDVIDLNRQAFAQLHCPRELAIIPGATHLFEEPGALEEVARLASVWFRGCFARDTG